MKYRSGRKYFLRLLFLVLVSEISTLSFSQNLSQQNWYFGNSTNAIIFNRADNSPSLITTKATPFGTGGSAVATDPGTADLLFYTDGNNVFDVTNQPMPNGNGLTANSVANQPVVICPVPGQTNKYFIFTNTANYTTVGTVSRSVVDMTLFGNSVFPSPAAGDLQNPKNVAVPGLNNVSEGMIIVPHANGTDFWLITQQNGTTTFSATLINAASYTGGTFTTKTTAISPYPITVSNFSYFSKTKKLAVSAQNPGTNALILTFDDTGTAPNPFSAPQQILNSADIASVATEAIYDIQWDQKGRYLYISRTGNATTPADLLQYDYLNQNITLTSVLTTPVYRSYGLQLAPDSTIYYLYQATSGGPFLVDRFTKTDTIASSVIRTPTPFGATTNFNGTQFPSFAPKSNVNLKVSFTYSAAPDCQNTPISFFPTVTPNADSLHWVFGDGKDTTLWSPIHTYTTAQGYSVTLTAYYQGQVKDTTETITISSFALTVTMVQDTTACRCQLPGRRTPTDTCTPNFSVTLKVSGGTADSIRWSNGDSGATLMPDSAGYYYAVVYSQGCSAYAGVTVKEYGLNDKRENIWYFGNKAGINFNVQPPKALNTSVMNAPAGCAIACDMDGMVIFYTDGSNVWDKTNTLISPPTGIGGDPNSSQSALIIPVTGDQTLYYIFTTQAINGVSNNELRYSLFDLKKGAHGAVTQSNILLFSKSTERITGNANWLVAHEYGNNTFRAYPISQAGIGDPVYSAIGSPHSFSIAQNGDGYMNLGGKNNLAVALSSPGVSNLVELFNFSDSTGKVTNYQKIDLQTPTGQVYGVEFSKGGNKLYATVDGLPTPSELFEYSLDSLDKPHLKQKLSEPAELGAIQLGPDGQIYVAVNDAAHNTSLGLISPNEDTTQLSTFQLTGFPLAAGTNSQLGLPNFIQEIQNGFGGPAMSFTGLCLGDSTHFVGTPTDPIDVFQWFFGDGGSSTLASPAHLYAAAGTYTVSMHLTNRCKLDTTLVQKITISPPPPNPTVPAASVLCHGPVLLNANTGNLSGLTYLWSTGDTTKTITVTQPEVVTVTNTNSVGCSSTASASIGNAKPIVSLGPNVTACQNTALSPLDAQNQGDGFAWKLNGVLNGNVGETQAVDTSTPSTNTYEVTITDAITTCTASDSVTVTVNVSPSFTFSGTNPTACNTATGTIQIQLNATVPVGGPYSYFLTGPNGFSQQGIDQTAPSTVGPFAGQKAGTFSGILTDQVSGCTTSNSFGLSDASYTATAAALAPNCNPVTVEVTNTDAPGSYPIQYTFTDAATGQVISGTASATVFDVAGLSQGTYTIQLTDAGNCTYVINNFVVNPGTPVTVTVTPSICATPPTITATGATGYSWSSTVPGSIVGSTTTATIQVLPNAGTAVIFTVIASSAGSCPNTQMVTVNLTSPGTPTFTQSNACSTQVVLTASPVGNYVYQWSLGGTLVAAGQQTTVTTSGQYTLTINDPTTGCNYSSTAQDVQVLGTVTAGLSATQACNNGTPFTLTATTNVSGPTYVWSLNGTVISGANAATLSQTSAGTYEVQITEATCSATADLTVIKAPIPAGSLPSSAIICHDPDNPDSATQHVHLNPGVFSQYKWFDNEINLNYTEQIYTATSQGFYQVELTNSYGCTSTDSTNVTETCEPIVTAPTAFRPGSSIVANQQFYVFTFFITDNFQVFIYNRWGELVFQSNDRNFKWNGGFNNQSPVMAGGTYAYVIKFVSSYQPELGIQEKHGGVVLLR